MTNYYLIFFLLGALLFAAIAVYSMLQQRNAKQQRRREYDDPLLSTEPSAAESGSEKDEPVVKKAAAELGQSAGTVAGSENSTVSDLGAARDKASAGGVASESQVLGGAPEVDSASSEIVTDLVARINNPEPIEQQQLLSLFRKHDFKFHRKIRIYGLNQLTDLWRDIEFELPSARFVELGVSIQLADRDGGMSQKELHDFQQMVLEFTTTFDAPFEFSMDIDAAHKQAQLLDQLGRRFDSMAVLNVVAKSKNGFRIADIESCARDLMMSTDKNGIFLKTRGQKQNLSILYRLACTDGSGHFGISGTASTPVYDLVLYMNVPATAEPERVFQEMVEDANNLATWLDGKVVDKNGRVMTQRSYSTLLQQISDIAYSMQQDGLTAGDPVSKKLF
ncbi:MAG: hypothetical protein HKN50_08730 [Gammaproteobacteria bacterium]|nr:hypothetical protein [Gammaproteobacteria bacterium]